MLAGVAALRNVWCHRRANALRSPGQIAIMRVQEKVWHYAE